MKWQLSCQAETKLFLMSARQVQAFRGIFLPSSKNVLGKRYRVTETNCA
jgi:hypothetical protein